MQSATGALNVSVERLLAFLPEEATIAELNAVGVQVMAPMWLLLCTNQLPSFWLA